MGTNSLATTTQRSFDDREVRFRRAREALAELKKRGPGPEVPAVVVEILTLHRRVNSLATFVPFIGPWLIARSDAPADQKFKLHCISATLTTVTIAGMLALLQSFGAPPVPLHDRLQAQIQTLGEIAQEFRGEHGSYPDPAIWKRTAEQPDVRFFDPWDRPYRYENTEDGGVTIETLGRDCVEGGTDEDADVSAHFAPPDPAASEQ